MRGLEIRTMSFVSEKVFINHTAALTESLCSASEQFARDRAMKRLDRNSLRQMSTPLAETASEMLRFGHDMWPSSANETEESDAIIVKPPMIKRMTRRAAMPTLMATSMFAITVG